MRGVTGTGKMSAHPVYLSLGNIIRQRRCLTGNVIIATCLGKSRMRWLFVATFPNRC
jgi:hypothetical protein